MKLKINKACDLNSISVLPPQSRRLSGIPNGSQSSQIRSQQSQQSFSQGYSSQHGMFSQMSQTSFDSAPTSDQRFNSQERENSVKKPSCFPSITYAREDSQMPLSRSSTTLMRKWNPTSVPDHKCQINEGPEHRIGMLETAINKLGMILASVQSDVMQVNKGTKEISVEMEGIRQKLVGLDTSLQQMIKGQDDTKFTLDGSLKSISERLSKDIFQDRLQQIFLVLSALPQQMEACLLKLQSDLNMTFTKEQQAAACNESPNQNSPSILMLPALVPGSLSTSERKPRPIRNPVLPSKACGQSSTCPKIEMGTWNSVKTEQATRKQQAFNKEQKYRGDAPIQKDEQCSVLIESDEEIDGVFACLIDEKESGIGNYTLDEATEESERILRKARRRKRKHCNTIIID